MLFKLQPIIYSLIFALALEVVVYRDSLFMGVGLFLVVFSILVVWPLARKLRFLAIPFFLSLGSLNLLFLIDSIPERQAFVVLSTVVYYLATFGAYRLKHYDCDQTAQGMINLATISTIFFWYVSNYGWFLNFQIDTWVIVATFIGSTFLISLPSLRICASIQMKRRKEAEERESAGISEKEGPGALLPDEAGDCQIPEQLPTYRLINNWVIIFLNFILSLVMAQVIWSLSLWPFGYLTTGVSALIIYFIFWDVIRNFVQGTLTKRVIVVNIALATLSVAGILATTKWDLVI